MSFGPETRNHQQTSLLNSSPSAHANGVPLSPEGIPEDFLPPIQSPPALQSPSLTARLPTIASLAAVESSVSSLPDTSRKIAWAEQVVALATRGHARSGSKSPITNPKLLQLAQTAVKHIVTVCDGFPGSKEQPSSVSLAFFLRGTLRLSGLFPTLLPQSQNKALQDFNQAAQRGYGRGWFEIARDWESSGRERQARKHFERGIEVADKHCLYRIALAHLHGQLGLPPDPSTGISLLRESADQADVELPQPAYDFGMILLDEFDLKVPSSALASLLPPPTPLNPDPRTSEARSHILRAAFLHYSPAQYKCGRAYALATMGCPFDPLLSLQWYSLASQQGEAEAHLALSQWFLCGAKDCFDRDEKLAVTYAEMAANAGLPDAELAMGYYLEMGVSAKTDLKLAKQWYRKAADHGNSIAADHLEHLSNPTRPGPIWRDFWREYFLKDILDKLRDAKLMLEGADPDTINTDRGDNLIVSTQQSSKIPPPLPKRPTRAPKSLLRAEALTPPEVISDLTPPETLSSLAIASFAPPVMLSEFTPPESIDPSSLPDPISPQTLPPTRDGLCLVCQEEPANVVILDCRHLSFCAQCSDIIMDSTRECPLCHMKIAMEWRLLRLSYLHKRTLNLWFLNNF